MKRFVVLRRYHPPDLAAIPYTLPLYERLDDGPAEEPVEFWEAASAVEAIERAAGDRPGTYLAVEVDHFEQHDVVLEPRVQP